jgi:dihydroorotate dehydrogenase (fumarate)
MDLSTTYLGLTLPNPFMSGASPLVDDLDTVRRLEDAGAAAIVMHSLFEEQLVSDQLAHACFTEARWDSHPEALSYLPQPAFSLGPDEYLEQIRRIKRAVAVPVIASLNGLDLRGWQAYAPLLEAAGADALELNVYALPTDPFESAETVEDRVVTISDGVLDRVGIPIAVKLSPFYTAPAHLARRLDRLGVAGLVLFNRLYQPDIDIERLEVQRTLQLSDSSELLLRVTWLAVLSAQVRASLAVSGGVHTAVDAIKAIMAGAHGVQLVSTLLRNGPDHLRTLRTQTEQWMEEHGYESLAQMRGSMNLERCPDPEAFGRLNYVHVLHSWRS